MSEEQPKLATRASSEKVLNVVNPIMTETVGGSADLTGSNNTKSADMGVFLPETARAAISTTAFANTAWPLR